MKWLTCVLLCFLAAPLAQAQGRRSASKEWLADYVVARDLARKTGKPLMVVFRCEP